MTVSKAGKTLTVEERALTSGPHLGLPAGAGEHAGGWQITLSDEDKPVSVHVAADRAHAIEMLKADGFDVADGE